jgi:hypothetical protein
VTAWAGLIVYFFYLIAPPPTTTTIPTTTKSVIPKQHNTKGNYLGIYMKRKFKQ